MLEKGDVVTLRYLPRGESRNFKPGDRLQLHGFDGRRGKFLATRPVGSAHFSLNKVSRRTVPCGFIWVPRKNVVKKRRGKQKTPAAGRAALLLVVM